MTLTELNNESFAAFSLMTKLKKNTAPVKEMHKISLKKPTI